MIDFSIGVLFIIFAYFFSKSYKVWFNPGSIFLYMWGGVFILYSFRLFSINSITSSTRMVFFVGILSFVLGYLPLFLSSNKGHNFPSVEDPKNELKIASNKRQFFLLLTIFSIVLYFIQFLQLLPYWLSGGVPLVKQANAEKFIVGSGIVDTLVTFIANPIQILTLFSFSIDFFFSRGRYFYIQTFLTLLLAVLKYLVSGSKFSLIMLILPFLLVYLIYSSVNKSLDKRFSLSRYKSLILILTFFIVYLLQDKEGDWVRSLYFYLVGNVPFGDFAITHIENQDIYFYGFVTFNGLFRLFTILFKFIGVNFDFFNIVNEAYDSMLLFEKAVYISPTEQYNAFTSIFTYFYKDGGIYAVIVFSGFLGWLSKQVYRKLNYQLSYFNVLLYLVLCYVLFFSLVRIQTYNITVVLALFYAFLLFQGKELDREAI